MNSQIESSFEINSWEETTYSEIKEGPKLIRASVKQTYSGPMKGKSTLEFIMTSFGENFSKFTGLEQFNGELEGRMGSFVLKHSGKYHDDVSTATCEIVPNSGTGDLEGISGTGNFKADQEKATLKLLYEFKENAAPDEEPDMESSEHDIPK